ncbi:protein kinase, putative [Entamoeba histolytica HM-1:IMSS-B]|uniref:Protein kinase, putative n=6 Tax=Entamoeba histolytica TaxID=5759 RepID=B1N304_ENTH1|nr:protein kinase, putative [Entamoeba histolytica HM-1:IMSS]EMD48886.1 protein kinase, putative [Entamoeba histolytica KU27]EMH76779.1 protein kinase, putative [Entamoeba histolytica HM-1:IMSS-B]EMS16366.1 protein kinase, putative [Entamoeba histolytica HM-3:IMSS]ENY63386.1 protein kinase, putative [Entamoeba histolytica HM-1:IMSS-A]GAT93761.1 protein kinase putative [Entamoeba histolytica]|eukprot:XP_001913570.1 protein kinase, putative [Entamoeba histolytica HM-1:IMSS]
MTEVSCRLSPSDIVEERIIGEGSFGVVFLGYFKGNKVAIKKLKKLQVLENMINEFKDEVSMLEKFRNEYIVHFYGAVMIPNKLCFVTEFAEYGSLSDLIEKRMKNNPLDEKLKIKFCLDAAKGIEYLHSNGILHRDIKPDNILAISLEKNVEINGKLTDFGSSRNINMLMTNMTFTKGIGTPVYMAPEILKKDKYKMPADVYSFAVTMLHILMWNAPYQGSLFKYPWSIANFVADGNRLDCPENVSPECFELIEQSWVQNPKERLSINEIVIKLQQLYDIIQIN